MRTKRRDVMTRHSSASQAKVRRFHTSQRLEVQQLEPRNAPGDALPLVAPLWGLSPFLFDQVGLVSEIGLADAPRREHAQPGRRPASALDSSGFALPSG